MEMMILDVYRLTPEQKAGSKIAVASGEQKSVIQLAEQKTGFGVRKFFVCPVCGERRVKLYFVGNGFKCATCGKINLYTGIQNGTKGGERELEYRMMRFAAAHEIGEIEWPFDYRNYIFDTRMSRTSFRRKIAILQALENMRSQNIFFKTVYSQKAIKAVLTGKHPLLKEKTLYELQKWFWDF